MLAKYMLMSGALLAFHGPLFAQQAELLHFGGPRDDLVIHVGNPDRSIDAVRSQDRVDLSSELAADFSQIGTLSPAHPVPAPSSIDVPEWMRIGVRSSSLSPGRSFSPSLSSGMKAP